MTDDDEDALTVDDEIVARARIHAREVLEAHDLEVDRDALEWDVSTRARRRAGACRWDADREVATIVLTRAAYRQYDWETFAGVVRHELVHAWEFQQFGESGHGSRFRERASRLEAPRYCESFSDPRYVLRCRDDDCDWEARRHRASKPVKAPDRYRCGACGGAYEVEHAASGRTWTTASGFGGVKAALGAEW
ncbi:SprT-like domain-containing protein [Haloterrigena sp. SYSU A558-1]|uniref:SprT-like domain-containing protein n=1 Tax=Haloterrigena gelatinilytica TaxID=2741724 RepID=A0A8J8GP46_9EURY|nr:SprT-like domain-containing protein [Haloterrigena gelatinilytica]NUB90980.1 SprT-like domain-containing protein [Haloterrigena gelatinilytica]NUC73202.1 SprT-like domain-containing protein [Haloterrigena gelatinilytica]